MADNKVYLVSSGEYSDYCINAAFSTLEAAKNYCRYRNGSFANDGSDGKGNHRIEEMELDTKLLAPPAGYDTYTVAITMSGQYSDIEVGTFGYAEYDRVNPCNPNDLGKRHDVTFLRGCTSRHELPEWPNAHVAIENYMEVYVLAKNPKHAVKIANERRAFCVANNLFDIAMQSRYEAESRSKRCRYASKDDIDQSWVSDIVWAADDAQE